MKRRDFIVVISSAVVAWPAAAHAQQSERTRRIGLLTGLAESEPSITRNIREFRLALERLGGIAHQRSAEAQHLLFAAAEKGALAGSQCV